MINIFGKLYTLLRRPQAVPVNATAAKTPTENTHLDPTRQHDTLEDGPADGASGGLVEDCALTKTGSESGVLDPTISKLRTESTTSADWEHIQPSDGKINVSTNIDINVSANVDEGFDVITDSDVNHGKDAYKTQIDEDKHQKKNGVEMKSSAITTESDVGKFKVSDHNQTNKDEHVKQNESGNKKKAIDKKQNNETIDEQRVNSTDHDKEQSVSEKQMKTDGEPERKESMDQATCAHKESALEEGNSEEVDDKSCPVVEDDASSLIEQPEHVEKHSQKSGNKGKRDRKVCKYFKKGQKCWKDKKCPFAHVNSGYTEMEDADKENVSEKEKEQSQRVKIVESDYATYLDYALAMTEHGRQIAAKDLVYKLGYMRSTDRESISNALIGQFKMAKSRENLGWMKEARYLAEMFYDNGWIDENMPLKEPKHRGKKQPKSKKSKNDAYDPNPGGICRDFRLKSDPSLPVIVTNAAGDAVTSGGGDMEPLCMGDNVTSGGGDTEPQCTVKGTGDVAGPQNTSSDGQLVDDYTEQVIQKAMTMAINDGLSQSAIMEVIEDVTSITKVTPRKQTQPTTVDLTQTPRSRFNQLAIGFNYHSEVVAKESRKTPFGEIYQPVQASKSPEDHLAVGFSFHANQLLKDARRTECGEVIIPGVIVTPGKRTRDQLAVGFSYHANELAKDISVDAGKNEAEENEKSSKEDVPLIETLEKDLHVDIEDIKKGRKLFQDTYAIGFSYHSDLAINKQLVEINGNMDSEFASSLVQDAAFDEDRNLAEIESELPPLGRLPAGSVW
ncbi:uncharacterized protein LOC127854247 isoform X2 [Dreissena polymorpha]|uniref:C3H1-type domain-containing protein n=1 Tax=Dreissena polymorpha TaxID=45954 RepID=A0A9D4CJS9_DREPO|nr:uncharacterized protein LOC127854247 isoform X2 [Dreissena polymorpha]KAH3725753.1 hypothetical protein DPMN_051602 [Dreissena polymorpha]